MSRPSRSPGLQSHLRRISLDAVGAETEGPLKRE